VKINCQFQHPEKFKRYKRMSKELNDRLQQAVSEVTTNTSLQARNIVVKDTGVLQRSIKPFVKGLTGEIVVWAEYGPYVEFGTGSGVSVPGEFTDYAMQFKGKGIREVNLPARPYLLSTFVKNRVKFIAECNKILRKTI